MGKAIFIDPTFYNNYYSKKIKKKSLLRVFCRNNTLIPKLVNTKLWVYNGKIFLKVRVSESIIGYKFGDFSCSRKNYLFKKGKVAKNKK